VTAAVDVTRPTVSIPEACRLARVARRTIYTWLAAGKVEYIRTAGGSPRIFVDTLFSAPHPKGWTAEHTDL
jgi:excisionase family DNA binding protein